MSKIVNDLRQRARNLERYPFESATMAEAGRLAAKHLREVAEDHDEWRHRGWHISADYSCPSPARTWSAHHLDFDGEGDNRQVFAATYKELLVEIDEFLAGDAA